MIFCYIYILLEKTHCDTPNSSKCVLIIRRQNLKYFLKQKIFHTQQQKIKC